MAEQLLYGIKEVADVDIYPVGTIIKEDGKGYKAKDGQEETPIVSLNSLKVSNIEMTAEQAEARGGKGNPALIIWDYGKEVNVTLEDATFTDGSLELLLGTKKSQNTFSITPNTFPGSYAVVGKTLRRDENGADTPFYFIIPKAKLSSEVNLTMEADGDPSVYTFNLKALRSTKMKQNPEGSPAYIADETPDGKKQYELIKFVMG